jgi:phage I-like protein
MIEPKADQPETWCHLAPFGSYDYRVTKGGKPVKDKDGKDVIATQILDAQGLGAVEAAFEEGELLLVDREHWSMATGDSTAMGWIMKVELRGDGTKPEDGLWCLIRWTDVGADMVANRRLRWLSPVWDTDKDERPVKLICAALTNTARFKDALNPVVNKADGANNETAPGLVGKEVNTMTWEQIAQMLGLDPKATPEQVAEKIKELQTFKADSEKAKTANDAEAAYAANKDKICNKADFIGLYCKDPAAGEAFVKTLGGKAPDKKDPVTNKTEARKPSFAGGGNDPVQNKLEQFEAMPEGAAKDTFQRDNAAELLTLQRQRDSK